MFGTIKDLFGAGKNAHSVLTELRSEKRNTRGIVNAILAETEFNMSLILEHYLVSGAKALSVIRQLKVAHLSGAIDEGFDFRKMHKGKVTLSTIGHTGFFKTYVGKDCEHVMKSIRFHVDQLKLLPELYDLEETSSVNVKARLENLGKRYVLLTRFLRSG